VVESSRPSSLVFYEESRMEFLRGIVEKSDHYRVLRNSSPQIFSASRLTFPAETISRHSWFKIKLQTQFTQPLPVMQLVIL